MTDNDQMDAGRAEELRNIYANQPVWAGDTIAYSNTVWLSEHGYIQRNGDGEWVTTSKGNLACER